MKTKLSVLMVLALLVTLFVTSNAFEDGPIAGGILSAGHNHAFALTSNGAVDARGNHPSNQANSPAEPSTQISTDGANTYTLTSPGAVDSAGSATWGSRTIRHRRK